MSLNLRIILSATLVLVTFITLTAAALDRAFIDSTESALRDKLTSQLYALMAAAEVTEQNIIMPSNELDALLGLPSSGMYAFITDKSGDILWRTASTLGATPPLPESLKSGVKRFHKTRSKQDEYYSFSHGVNWETETRNISLTFNITTDLNSFNKQINEYRTTLWGWLLAMAILLLISQAVILRWGLFPLRKVGTELNKIETGEQQKIEASYPQEIEQLTSNINLLLQQERNQKTRYRNALGDLAHSLKTPLAVLQSGISRDNTEQQQTTELLEQITRMNSIVEYQLQRASTAGASSIGQPINIKSVTNRLLDSLQKVYLEKAIKVDVSIDDDIFFKGDEGDLMELLGNLMDNAFKWATHNIKISAKKSNNKLSVSIMDDGPGIAAEQIETLLQRGTRADQAVLGHGIGLSIVSNIIEAYQGELIIKKSSLGGAEIVINI